MGILDDSYTKALLHMDGADASTTFTDESDKTWTAGNHAQIDTAQKVFGTASGLFDGTDDYINTADHDDFWVSNLDFTIEAWVRRNATGRHIIYGQTDFLSYATNSLVFEIGASHKLTLQLQTGTSEADNKVSIATTSITADGNWHHVAGVRYGNNMFVFVDGSKEGITDVTSLTALNVSIAPSIGRPGTYGGCYWNGWIDEFRFSKGIARWTSNFTPQVFPYTAGGQVIICESE